MKNKKSDGKGRGGNVLVVEFSAWHDECLYTTCLLLKSQGYRVTLALNADLENRIGDSLAGVSDAVRYYPFKKGVKGICALLRLYRSLLSEGFTHACFNSAQGSEAWKFFLLPFPKRIRMFGTIHNLRKLTGSFGQRFITRRIDGYILLSDLLVARYREVCGKPSAAIYPVFYPSYCTYALPKQAGELWITIPGAVSLERRDYLSLLPPHVKYAPHIKFIILGNRHKADGQQVYEAVQKAGVQANFLFFDGFVPEDEFYSYVIQSDYIMPLVHSGHGGYGKYLTEKISGTYNLAIAYRKPMLCPTEMEAYEDFRDSALFYAVDRLPAFINSLSPASAPGDNFYRLPKWTQEVQQKRLADFLGLLEE